MTAYSAHTHTLTHTHTHTYTHTHTHTHTRLAILNIPSLECRRAYNDLVYLYKIIHGLCDSRLSSLFPHSDLSSHSTLRRHCFQLSLPKPRTDLIKYSFCYRSTKLWNSLPTHIANSPSISHFKLLIYRYLCDLYKNS